MCYCTIVSEATSLTSTDDLPVELPPFRSRSRTRKPWEEPLSNTSTDTSTDRTTEKKKRGRKKSLETTPVIPEDQIERIESHSIAVGVGDSCLPSSADFETQVNLEISMDESATTVRTPVKKSVSIGVQADPKELEELSGGKKKSRGGGAKNDSGVQVQSVACGVTPPRSLEPLSIQVEFSHEQISSHSMPRITSPLMSSWQNRSPRRLSPRTPPIASSSPRRPPLEAKVADSKVSVKTPPRKTSVSPTRKPSKKQPQTPSKSATKTPPRKRSSSGTSPSPARSSLLSPVTPPKTSASPARKTYNSSLTATPVSLSLTSTSRRPSAVTSPTKKATEKSTDAKTPLTTASVASSLPPPLIPARSPSPVGVRRRRSSVRESDSAINSSLSSNDSFTGIEQSLDPKTLQRGKSSNQSNSSKDEKSSKDIFYSNKDTAKDNSDSDRKKTTKANSDSNKEKKALKDNVNKSKDKKSSKQNAKNSKSEETAKDTGSLTEALKPQKTVDPRASVIRRNPESKLSPKVSEKPAESEQKAPYKFQSAFEQFLSNSSSETIVASAETDDKTKQKSGPKSKARGKSVITEKKEQVRETKTKAPVSPKGKKSATITKSATETTGNVAEHTTDKFDLSVALQDIYQKPQRKAKCDAKARLDSSSDTLKQKNKADKTDSLDKTDALDTVFNAPATIPSNTAGKTGALDNVFTDPAAALPSDKATEKASSSNTSFDSNDHLPSSVDSLSDPRNDSSMDIQILFDSRKDVIVIDSDKNNESFDDRQPQPSTSTSSSKESPQMKQTGQTLVDANPITKETQQTKPKHDSRLKRNYSEASQSITSNDPKSQTFVCRLTRTVQFCLSGRWHVSRCKEIKDIERKNEVDHKHHWMNLKDRENEKKRSFHLMFLPVRSSRRAKEVALAKVTGNAETKRRQRH